MTRPSEAGTHPSWTATRYRATGARSTTSARGPSVTGSAAVNRLTLSTDPGSSVSSSRRHTWPGRVTGRVNRSGPTTR